MAMSPWLKNGCKICIAFTGRSPALRGMGCSSCHIRNVSDPRFVQSLLNDPPPPSIASHDKREVLETWYLLGQKIPGDYIIKASTTFVHVSLHLHERFFIKKKFDFVEF